MPVDLEPTTDLDPNNPTQALAETNVLANPMDQSRIRVDSQSRSGDRVADLFDESTRLLLRERLMIAMVIIATMMLVAQVMNFIMGTVSVASLTSRMTAAAALFGSATLLWRRPGITLSHLRRIEIVVIVVPLVEVMMMQYLETTRLIEIGKPYRFPALVAGSGSVVGLFIATYAMFIPSNWRRTAIVGFTYAIVATAMSAVQLATTNGLEGIEPPRFTTTFVLFATAVIATFAAHFVRSIRHDVESARQYGQYHLTTEIGRGGMGVVYRSDWNRQPTKPDSSNWGRVRVFAVDHCRVCDAALSDSTGFHDDRRLVHRSRRRSVAKEGACCLLSRGLCNTHANRSRTILGGSVRVGQENRGNRQLVRKGKRIMTFNTLLVEKTGEARVSAAVQRVTEGRLPTGNVTARRHHSDGLVGQHHLSIGGILPPESGPLNNMSAAGCHRYELSGAVLLGRRCSVSLALKRWSFTTFGDIFQTTHQPQRRQIACSKAS
ncbi:hypothetical protein Poly41_24090 [Novipirellula artificiosorum]|uniref:Uncharacterized protein n=1 Tax=Novipirellula artificiosorum TaxID=2528016 RepID=A0A5C6DTM9_9BACT|nr:hypothetical protein Poly41_24090 [Novipirellula artificiosorum]